MVIIAKDQILNHLERPKVHDHQTEMLHEFLKKKRILKKCENKTLKLIHCMVLGKFHNFLFSKADKTTEIGVWKCHAEISGFYLYC